MHDFESEIFDLKYILLLLIMFVIAEAAFLLFTVMDNRFDIKIKYFSLVAVNRVIFYAVFIIWTVILFGFAVISVTMDSYYVLACAVLYYSVFLSLYENVRNWKTAYNVYIKNVGLLIKAKERDRKKKKK